MYIGQVMRADTANGIGIRISVFVSGCRNHCKGCFQPETWNFNYGYEYTEDIKRDILKELQNSFYDGITVLGGEPLEPENQKDVLELIREVKKLNKTVWLYTGCVYEQDIVADNGRCRTEYIDELLNNVDVLVDGPFEEDKKNIELKFRGSENQRLIAMRQTRQSGDVVLLRL